MFIIKLWKVRVKQTLRIRLVKKKKIYLKVRRLLLLTFMENNFLYVLNIVAMDGCLYTILQMNNY